MFGGDRFEDLIGQISIGKSTSPSGGGCFLPLPPPPSVFVHLQKEHHPVEGGREAKLTSRKRHEGCIPERA
jgi:hypothetical protein